MGGQGRNAQPPQQQVERLVPSQGGERERAAAPEGCGDESTVTVPVAFHRETAVGAPPRTGELPQRWRAERLLGRGGQGEVWLVWDRQLEQFVALKVLPGALSDRQKARLRREVGEGRKLAHPHLVQVYELVEWDGHLTVVMEWVPGGSVRQKIEEGPRPVPEVVAMAEQVLEALAFLHARGYVHRDVKPANILLTADGQYKLGDLGLLLPMGEKTATLAGVGTLTYMSPEQRLGEEPGPPSDLYSLAVTLYECLTGQVPAVGWGEGGPTMTVPNPRRQRRDCPRWLGWFIGRMGQADPRQRFADAGKALTAFRCRRSWPIFSRRKTVFAVAVASLALALAFLSKGSRPTAAVRWEGNEVLGVDARGETAWQYRLVAPVKSFVRVDLDGDGTKDWVFAAGRGGCFERDGAPNSQILAVSPSGKLLMDVFPERLLFPEERVSIAPPLFVPALRLLDLDGDGEDEIVASLRHRCLGTSLLAAYWPKRQMWQRLVDHYGGWITSFGLVPETQPRALQLVALNTTLGGFVVGARVPVEIARGEVGGLAFEVPGCNFETGQPPLWYSPLASEGVGVGPGFSVSEEPVFRGDGTAEVWWKAAKIAVDRWGNPMGSVAWGRDFAATRRRCLAALVPGGELSRLLKPDEVEAFESRWREWAGPLVEEEPFRAVHAIFFARQYASVGAASKGLDLLEAAWRQLGYGGLALAYAHLLAVQGRRLEAQGVLLQALSGEGSSTTGFRVPQLFARIALDMDGFDLWRDRVTKVYFSRQPGVEPLEVARARVWFDRPEDSDLALESHDLLPEGAALAAVAAWRRGQLPHDAGASLEEKRQRNPDAIPEFFLAEGLARAQRGDLERALELLAQARWPIVGGHKERWNYLAWQTLVLIEACRAKLLLTAGKVQEARDLAAALLPQLPPGRLPANLVAEVLAATEPTQAHVSRGSAGNLRVRGAGPRKGSRGQLHGFEGEDATNR
ncbi:MAG: serine/threonine-protein kinase [Thermoanaerobaculum sp.]